MRSVSPDVPDAAGVFAGKYPDKPSRPLLGVGFMVLSGLCGVSMSVVIRYISGNLHPFEIAFFRNLFGIGLLLPFVLRAGVVAVLSTRHIRLHALRGALNAAGMLTFFLALTLAPIVEVSALSFTSPLFGTILAAVVIGETVGPRRRIGLLIGLLGALILLRPGFVPVNAGALLTLLSAVALAGAMVTIKLLTRSEGALTITTYAALFIAAFSLPPAMLYWTWPSATELAWLVVIALLGTLTQLCLARAFAEAEATLLLPVEFLRLLWAALFGYIFFSELVDLWTWLGGLTILSGAVYVAYRERTFIAKGD